MRSGGGLDIEQLEQSVISLLGASIAMSTSCLYRSGYARYWRFCVSTHVLPLPTSEQILCLFVASLDNAQLSHASIKYYLLAVRHLRFSMAIVTRSLPPPAIGDRAMGNQEATGGGSSSWTLARYTEVLRILRHHWSPRASDFDVAMLWGACCLGFFVFICLGWRIHSTVLSGL